MITTIFLPIENFQDTTHGRDEEREKKIQKFLEISS
jgi:hypothetical protein